MRKLAYEYYLKNGALSGMTSSDLGVDGTCDTTNFYRYNIAGATGDYVSLQAYRCTVGGKSPNTTRAYWYYGWYYPGTGVWKPACYYVNDHSPCFGLPANP
ncbi:MAG: hypothetical protein PHW54_03080 [Candidatus Omnitrophica bacterium]|nr:hypothetical protein [Candidatus Omnitrophota bacterium]